MRRIIWVAFLVICASYIAWRQQHDRVFETDMLKLLPSWSNDAMVQQARDTVRHQALAQTIFLIGHRDFSVAKQQAMQWTQYLKESGVFESVQCEVAVPDIDALAQFYRPYSDRLLSDEEQHFLATNADAEIELLLQHWLSPVGLSLPDDKIGNLARFLQQHSTASARLSWREGVLSVDHDGESWVLVRAQTPDKVFDANWQEHAYGVIESRRQHVSDTHVVWTGLFKFARDARVQTAHEINVISALGTAGLLLLLWFVLRRVYPIVLMAAVIATSMLGATALSLLVYGQLHLITYVFGATLIGIAGDYALHYLVQHAASGAHWHAAEAMRRLAKPLTTALLTTVLAYAAICLTPFSGFRQMAVFCLFGLLCAYLAVVLALPECLAAPAAQPARGLLWFERGFRRLQQRPSVSLLLLLWLIFGVVCGYGGWRLNADDDIHLLQKPSPTLLAEQQQLAAITGFEPANQFFLVRADDHEQLLQREEMLVAALHTAVQRQQLKHFSAISQWLPSQQRQQKNQQLLQEASRTGAIQQAFAQLGAESTALPLSVTPLMPTVFFAQSFAQIMVPQWLTSGQQVGSIVTLNGVRDRDVLRSFNRIDGVQFIDERAAISTLFAEFRVQAMTLVAVAYLIVAIALWWQRGAKQMIRRLLPTVLATALTLALLAIFGVAINLFHGVALMLVLGIGVDYSLFLADGEGHEASSLLAIVLSAFTAMLAFGLLAFSHLPAVAGFGLTVLIGVALALVLAATVFWWRNE